MRLPRKISILVDYTLAATMRFRFTTWSRTDHRWFQTQLAEQTRKQLPEESVGESSNPHPVSSVILSLKCQSVTLRSVARRLPAGLYSAHQQSIASTAYIKPGEIQCGWYEQYRVSLYNSCCMVSFATPEAIIKCHESGCIRCIMCIRIVSSVHSFALHSNECFASGNC